MSSSLVSFNNLTWGLPDGRPLISNLNLTFESARIGLVGRNGVGKTTLLKLIAGELRPQSGRISINGRVGMLRQAVQANVQETVAHLFSVADSLALLRRAENGEATVEELADTDWSLESRIQCALARVGLEVGPETLVSEMSGGQRTRAGLAALVFGEPDFLLLDEPTNNLDREGRKAVIDLLARWRSGAIVISHDRELLETMDVIVELTSLGATRYGGNWSHYRECKELELVAAQHDLASAEKRSAEVARRTQESAERKARKDGAGQRKSAKGGAPRIALGLLKDRSERTSGDSARLFERRRADAQDAVADARKRIEVLQPFSVVLPSTHLPVGKAVLAIDAVTAGYAPDRPIFRNWSFAMSGPERVAITGPNGSGKTALLALITGKLAPTEGTVWAMTPFALLDQQVSLLDPTASIRDNFRRMHPETDENTCRAALARFMFRADAALQTVATLSGGQILRAGLACVLGGAQLPPLLILDEPTNHLDLDSIATIEAGLRAYDGALLVVSHDEAFLRAVGISRRVELSPVAPAGVW